MIHKIMYEFEVVVEPGGELDNEEKRYVAYCRELHGCYVHARTEDEALEKIEHIICRWISIANDHYYMDGGPWIGE